MKYLAIKNVIVQKGNTFILKDINLDFEENKIYGIIGNNGAGKTTLFKTLLGLIKFHGTIQFDDDRLTFEGSKEYLKHIGLVLPFPDNYAKRSIYEVFEEHLYYMDCKLSKSIDTILSDIGLHIPLETKIEALSLGMKQKLNIALALAHHPSILILDEPFNGLDREGIITLKKVIHQWKAPGKVVLIASHSFHELDDIISEVIVMNQGMVIAKDDMNRLRQKDIKIEQYYALLWKGNLHEK